MAKEAKETKVDNLNVDGIEEEIKKANVVTEEIAKKAGEEIAKQRKEKLTAELIDRLQKTDFTRKRILLSAKKTKKDGECKMNYLKKYTALAEQLKKGEISVDEFDKQARQEKSVANKVLRDNDIWVDEQRNILNDQYPGSWDWRYNEFVI